MGDSQVKNIGQIQPSEKPTKNEVSSGYQHCNPGSHVSWSGIQTSQHVENNDQVAREVVNLHDAPVGFFPLKSKFIANNRLKQISL